MELLLDRKSAWRSKTLRYRLQGFFQAYDDEDQTTIGFSKDSQGEYSLACVIVSGKNFLRMVIPLRVFKDGFAMTILSTNSYHNPNPKRYYAWEDPRTQKIEVGGKVPDGCDPFLATHLGKEHAYDLRTFVLESAESLITGVNNYYQLYSKLGSVERESLDSPEKILKNWEALVEVCETWGQLGVCSSEFDGENFTVELDDWDAHSLTLVIPFRVVSHSFTDKIHLGSGFTLPSKGVWIHYGKEKFVPSHYLCNGILENREKFRFYLLESSRHGRVRKTKGLVI